MSLFGTDGIRMLFSHTSNLSKIERIFKAVFKVISQKLLIQYSNLYISYGYDTRDSSIPISLILSSVAAKYGITLINIGIKSTPAIARIGALLGVDATLVISASHNPSAYNGIKIFLGEGKITEDYISLIEKEYNTDTNDIGNFNIKNSYYESITYATSLYKRYMHNHFKDYSFNHNLKFIVDVANGSTYSDLYNILSEFNFSKFNIINNNISSNKINDRCGSTNIKTVNNSSIYFYYDGDGDRLIFTYYGYIFDGDSINFLLSKYYNTNSIVMNYLSDISLRRYIRRQDYTITIVNNVGDKYIYNSLLKNKLRFGSESSGHIIDMIRNRFSDSIIMTLEILAILSNSKGLSYVEEICNIEKSYKFIHNISIDESEEFVSTDELLKLINNINSTDSKQIIIRKSGTENCIRIYYQSLIDDIKDIKDRIVSLVYKSIISN